MVTSSAVVGSSASSRRGWEAVARAIITRWRIPPLNSWGIGQGAALRVGNPDVAQELESARASLSLVETQVQA